MTTTLEIGGMSCGHCVKAVTLALQHVPGVSVSDVAVGRAVIDVDPSQVSRQQLVDAIDEAGFVLRAAGAAYERPDAR